MFSKGTLREYASALSITARFLDVLCVFLGGLIAYFIAFGNLTLPISYRIAILIGVLLSVIVFSFSGLYRSWRGQGWFNQARILTVSLASVIIILVTIAYLTNTSLLFSRLWMGLWVICSLSMLLLFRFSLNHLLRILRASGFNRRKIIIIGAGDLGTRVARALNNASWAGIQIMGFIDDNLDIEDKEIDGIKILGSIDKLQEIVVRSEIDEVWVALPLRAERRVKDILHELRHNTAAVRFVPDIFGMHLLNHSIVDVAGFPVLNITESPMFGLNRFVKFLEDKVIAGIILVLISPLLLIISLGVKLSSPGPVFYRQERVSWNGKPFMMMKFRSMPIDSESKTGAVWAKSGEDRATKFGAFLRRTSLDELPQFIDVLKGNMSIVGPRPERPIFVDQFKEEVPRYMKKHMMKAGITGWAQVNGWRGNTDLHKRIEHDLYYIDNWSFWFDIKIILLTLFKGFVHKNAY